jgi:hypothetical protein
MTGKVNNHDGGDNDGEHGSPVGRLIRPGDHHASHHKKN